MLDEFFESMMLVRKIQKISKLTKIRFLMEYIRRKSMKLFQPIQNISRDERMVKKIRKGTSLGSILETSQLNGG